MADWKYNKKYKYIAIILFRAPTWRVNGGTATTPAPLQNAQLWTGRDLARTVSFHSGYCFCSIQRLNTISMTNLVVQPWALGSWKALIFLSGGLGKFTEIVSLEPTVAIGWYRRENISKADRYFSTLPQNGFAKITPFLNTWKVNPEEFLGARLLQIIEGCSSKASGESAAILATVGIFY